MQRADAKLNKIITSVESELDALGYRQYFQVFKGSLFKKVEGRERDWRLVIPEGLIDKIVWDCHYRYGHFGEMKCVSEMCIRDRDQEVLRSRIMGTGNFGGPIII